MTYKEIFDGGMMKAGMVVPVSWLTPSLGMMWITEFINDAQVMLGTEKCTTEITLSATSTDGQYKLPCAIDAVDEITLSPTGTTPKQYQPITRMPLDAFHRLIQDWPDYNSQIDAWPWPYQDAWINTNLVYCAITGSQLLIYPYATPGLVTIHYKPLIPVYSKSSDYWASFGPDPSAQMAQANIPKDFEVAATALMAKVASRIVEAQPTGTKGYGPQWQVWQNEIHQGMRKLRRRNVDYVDQDTKQYTSLGGIF